MKNEGQSRGHEQAEERRREFEERTLSKVETRVSDVDRIVHRLTGHSPTQLRSSAPLNSKVAWFHCFFSVLYPVHTELGSCNFQLAAPLSIGQCARKSLQPPAHLAFATKHHRLSPQVSPRLPRISRLRPRPGSGTLSLSPPYLAPRQGALSLTSSPRVSGACASRIPPGVDLHFYHARPLLAVYMKT